MNRKSLSSYLALALLVAGLAAGVFFFMKGRPQTVRKPAGSIAAEQLHILGAVPSDAVGVMCFDSMSDALELFLDKTKAFSALLTEDGTDPTGLFLQKASESLSGGGLRQLRSADMAVSLHYNGSVSPLFIVEMPRHCNDSSDIVLSVKADAEACGLDARFHAGESICTMLISPSEALISSSVRHQEEGVSILNNSGFTTCASRFGGSRVMYFSNSHAPQLLSEYFRRPVTANAPFIRRAADWTAFSISTAREYNLAMDGYASCIKGDGSFMHIFDESGLGDCSFADIAPSTTIFAVSISTPDVDRYQDAYQKFLDASGVLSARKTARKALQNRARINPLEWARSLSVKEVVRVDWHTADGGLRSAVLVRPGRTHSYIFKGLPAGTDAKTYVPTANPYHFSGFAANLYGDAFALADESSFAYLSGWIVSGDAVSVSDLIARSAQRDCLRSMLDRNSLASVLPTRDCGFVVYYSATDSNIGELFRPALKNAVAATFAGANLEPAVLSLTRSGLSLEVRRALVRKSEEEAVTVTDAGVSIPKGPFRVFNSATGRTNLLSQQSNMYLSLKEEDGKGIWSIPFSEALCGYVENIDFYGNDRNQFLFAAGSRLYLLDRVGRFCGGFPVDLGKPVLLGPALYDLEGRRDYSVLVLHTDNTIGLYNLKGALRPEWEGMDIKDPVLALPQLIDVNGRRFWTVRTVSKMMVFPLCGGEPAYAQDGNKGIRSDSEIEVTEKGIRVTCNDGKQRNIKI